MKKKMMRILLDSNVNVWWLVSLTAYLKHFIQVTEDSDSAAGEKTHLIQYFFQLLSEKLGMPGGLTQAVQVVMEEESWIWPLVERYKFMGRSHPGNARTFSTLMSISHARFLLCRAFISVEH